MEHWGVALTEQIRVQRDKRESKSSQTQKTICRQAYLPAESQSAINVLRFACLEDLRGPYHLSAQIT